jgi:hypothetical protein
MVTVFLGTSLDDGRVDEPEGLPLPRAPDDELFGRGYGAPNVGDLDGDGLHDLVVDSGLGPFLLRGSELGTSGAWTGAPAFAAQVAFDASVQTTALGDVDGDGLSDLLCSVQNREVGHRFAYGWLVSGGDVAQGGTLDQDDAFGVLYLDETVGSHLYGVELGDLDGDGLAEATVNTVLFTGAVLQAGPRWELGLDLGRGGIPCDLDGDGLAELVGDDVLRGSALAAGEIEVWVSGLSDVRSCVGDLDRDGRQDYASADSSYGL